MIHQFSSTMNQVKPGSPEKLIKPEKPIKHAPLTAKLTFCSVSQVGDIVLCSWARHLTLSVPLSTQVKMGNGELNVGGNPAMD